MVVTAAGRRRAPIQSGRRAARLAGVVAFSVALAVAGCGGDSADDLPPPASTPPSPTAPAPSIDPAHQGIIDAYYGAIDAMVAAQAAGDCDHPALTQYFGEGTAALLELRLGIDRQQRQGNYYEGDLEVVSAEVTELRLTEDPPTATLTACLDDSGYQLVSRQDGTPVPGSSEGGRYATTSIALLHDDDRWYIIGSTAHWDEPC